MTGRVNKEEENIDLRCVCMRKQAEKAERESESERIGMRAQFVDSKAHETHNLAAYLLKGQ